MFVPCPASLIFQDLHSWVDSWPCLETLDLAGTACQGQTLVFVNYGF
jgi:hypothetical protein